jgi:hypothetical protein
MYGMSVAARRASSEDSRGIVRRLVSASGRGWPFVHLPLFLLLVAMCLWRYHRGYFVFRPNPAALIGDITRVDRWSYFTWENHPDQGPLQPYGWSSFQRQLLTGKDLDKVWLSPFPSTRFTIDLAARGLITEANHDFELANTAYPLLATRMRPGHRVGSTSWGGGTIADYTTSEGAHRIAAVWYEHLALEGPELTARVDIFDATTKSAIGARAWVVRFAMFDEAESVVWWWSYLLALFAAPVWFVVLTRRALRFLTRSSRTSRNECLECGYSRAGLAVEVCPECGHRHVPQTITPA